MFMATVYESMGDTQTARLDNDDDVHPATAIIAMHINNCAHNNNSSDSLSCNSDLDIANSQNILIETPAASSSSRNIIVNHLKKSNVVDVV